jgi:hypothetical protein
MDFKLLQSLKQPSPIFVTDFGIMMEVNFKQPEKQVSPIDVTELTLENITEVKYEKFW